LALGGIDFGATAVKLETPESVLAAAARFSLSVYCATLTLIVSAACACPGA